MGSKAVEADSHQTQPARTSQRWCSVAWCSTPRLAGGGLTRIAALGVVVFLVREGREAITAEHLDDCC